MGKPINVSNGAYSRLDNLRRPIPGKKAYESFNAVIVRLLDETDHTKEDTNGIQSDILTEAEED